MKNIDLSREIKEELLKNDEIIFLSNKELLNFIKKHVYTEQTGNLTYIEK